jgi:GT2 family glycosyltransferase
MEARVSDTQPSLRVQTVLYGNRPDELERAFEALLNALIRTGDRVERWVIAFGDSSPEPVLEPRDVERLGRAAAAAGGRFDSVFFGENLGHGGGHNRLHEHSDEELLLILNPDGILAPDAIVRLIEALDPGTGVIDARQLPMEHPKQYDAGTGEASWSSLACGLTPSAVFRQVGGIDHDTFFMYCDDVDYSWRVRLAGYTARYCPQARMFHDKRLDAQGGFIAGETERYYSAEAALLLAYKYSRDDVVANLERAMGASPDPNAIRALAEFHGRRIGGRLPERLDADHLVAEFTGGTYGEHRF